jgi:hypothetical protein
MTHRNEEISMSNTDYWATRREATLNWLALGLLLAAWNATDNDGGGGAQPNSRPEALRGYGYISVRSANRAAGIEVQTKRGIVTEL